MSEDPPTASRPSEDEAVVAPRAPKATETGLRSEAVLTVLRSGANSDAEMAADEAASPAYWPITRFDSGSSVGLAMFESGGLQWAFCSDEAGNVASAQGFSVQTALLFIEALEMPRSAFEGALVAGAERLGLPAETVLLSFPVETLLRVMLTKESTLYRKMAMHWLIPTDLRGLRAEIASVAADPALPQSLRDLAERALVPEAK